MSGSLSTHRSDEMTTTGMAPTPIQSADLAQRFGHAIKLPDACSRPLAIEIRLHRRHRIGRKVVPVDIAVDPDQSDPVGRLKRVLWDAMKDATAPFPIGGIQLRSS